MTVRSEQLSETATRTEPAADAPWYEGVTRYQWLVLLIASLGWVFDAFEGQIFVASMAEAMPSLVGTGTAAGQIALYNNIALGAFLAGGAIGGVVFGMLSDRIGRKKTLSVTILFYSIFTCLSAFSQEWWHLVGFRFLVALGVGGEWAVASALVAEVFPNRARAHAGGIFHATSVFGTYLAVAAGIFVIGNPAVAAWAQGMGDTWLGGMVDPATLPWRIGFAIGVFPALLIIWIRRSIHEPESWEAAQTRAREEPGEQMGALGDLFRGELLARTIMGVLLAAIGLATFWGAHIYGKNMLQAAAKAQYALQDPASLKRWEMLGMFLVTTGGGIGLVSFGPITHRLGRRKAFLLYHVGGLVSALLVFQVVRGVTPLIVMLPVFGFLTLGMHAGYAIYFPELYPTRLRGTGTGFCFNAGRMVAAPILFAVGWMQAGLGMSLPTVASLLSLLFILGAVVLLFAPETRGQELLE